MIARLLLIVLLAAPAAAQDDHAGHTPAAPGGGWAWRAEASVFAGVNHQERAFRDFTAWESQNWLMGTLTRQTARTTTTLSAMASLEALTLRDIGSPQVFQTGETFRGAPLIDYQHPHDLLMELGGRVSRRAGAFILTGAGFIVGAPALGPAPFMHRASAAGNPQAPLSHHFLDSSHITPGVLTGGIGRGAWSAEASWFQGLEPDEDRLDIDLAPPDSVSGRVSWSRGRWHAQLSGARLTRPERVTPFDADKITASVAYTAPAVPPEARSISWMLAAAQKREVHGHFEAYLFEAHLALDQVNALYTRAESVAKDVLDAGFHPTAFHRHRQSQVSALTAGYLRTLRRSTSGRIAAGADVTVYAVPSNLREAYGSPASFHAFIRVTAALTP